VQRGFQVLARSEVMALQHLLDPAIEALDPLPSSALEMHKRDAVCLGKFRWGQAGFDLDGRAERVEFVLARGRALAQAEETIGERPAIRAGCVLLD
jgi:hypothetical protein